ncbi:MAG TPA: hypothetical protein VN256_03475 [Pyrinomonadaceae bacterium]|nr:hypothetical protein [Pyrinomonadaceae bacterium]
MKFTPNTPFVSKTPTVAVDAGMAPGSYLFRLEVEDESGNKSRPDERVVVIERPVIVDRPIVIIDRPVVVPTKQSDRSPVLERNEDPAPEGSEGKDSRPPGESGRDQAKKPGRVVKTKAGAAGKKVGDDDEPS